MRPAVDHPSPPTRDWSHLLGEIEFAAGFE
jgi:hypothetical protein